MTDIYPVALPKSAAARVFPPCCAGCGADSGSGYQLPSRNRATALYLLHAAISSGAKIRVPLCAHCESCVRNRRALAAVVWIASIMAAGAVFFLTFGLDQGRFTAKIVVIGLAAVPLFFWHRWEDGHPLPFDIADHGEHLDFQFTDEEIAWQFAELNAVEHADEAGAEESSSEEVEALDEAASE